jgi:hypothetical protein
MKIRDLPSLAQLLAGLDPDSCHPDLPRARVAADVAAQTLDRRRAELADRERDVAALPPAIARGERKADALRGALVARDAAALLVAPAEQVLAKARVRVDAEERNAAAALDREFYKRASMLEVAVAEVVPVLVEIIKLASALGAARGGGAALALDWPSSPMAEMQRRQASMASAPATPSLVWSKS